MKECCWISCLCVNTLQVGSSLRELAVISLSLFLCYFMYMYMLMRDEKEKRKKQARLNKQQGKATQPIRGNHFSQSQSKATHHTQGSHFSQSHFSKVKMSCLGWDSNPRHSCVTILYKPDNRLTIIIVQVYTLYTIHVHVI